MISCATNRAARRPHPFGKCPPHFHPRAVHARRDWPSKSACFKPFFVRERWVNILVIFFHYSREIFVEARNLLGIVPTNHFDSQLSRTHPGKEGHGWLRSSSLTTTSRAASRLPRSSDMTATRSSRPGT